MRNPRGLVPQRVLFANFLRSRYRGYFYDDSEFIVASLLPFRGQSFHSLTLSLPESLMEFCKVTLTFESADKIL